MDTAETNERRPMRYWVGRAVLTALGWREEGVVPDVDKYVLIAAPHTSNWDLPVTLGLGYVMGIDVVWIGKHTLFEGPIRGPFYRWLGGIPVDRNAAQDQVQVLASAFDVPGKRVMVIAPEGTRAKSRYWKSGFYWIAHTAKVPIALGYIDFRRKRGGIGPMITPTGDVEADVARIHEFYERITAKFPEEFTNIEFRPPGEGAERPKRQKRGLRGRIAGLLHGMGWT